MSNLLQEAIADANRVKEIAYENAKTAIAEAFQPRIQRMISSRLAEDDLDTELDMDAEFSADPVSAAPVSSTVAPPMGGAGEEEEDPFTESKYIDDGKDGRPAEKLNSMDEGEGEDGDFDEKFESLIRELESDLSAEDEPALEPTDDVTIESLAKGLKEEDAYDDNCSDSSKNTGNVSMSEVARLRKQVSRLTKENKDALRAISTMKGAMNEVNLLNAKLMFSSKIMQNFVLSEKQQVTVLEAIDAAKSVREARLVFDTIKGNLQNQRKSAEKPANVRRTIRTVNESASRPIRTVKRTKLNESYDFANRWKVLAGLRGIND